MNLFQLLSSQADPSKTFLQGDEWGAFTYDEVFAVAAQYAHVLVSSGVRPGDRVAVQVEKTPQSLFLYLAALRAGAIYLPLNTAYTPAELDYFIADAEPRLIVCDPSKEERLAEIGRTHGCSAVLTLDAAGQGSLAQAAGGEDRSFADVAREDGDVAAILYTSGTTGRPKGAMLTHGNLGSNAQTLVEYWRFTDQDTLLHALPLFHTHGLFVACNTLMLAGGSLIFQSRFDAAATIRNLPDATAMMGVPTFYTRLLKEPGLTREACGHMRLFISGSAPLLAETHREFRERTGHAILERYGMTETGMSTSNPYDGDRVAGTVGFPLPAVEVRVVDAQGESLGPDELGGIELRGPNVFSGYWRLPEKTRAEFRDDGFFITGDVGKFDKRGYLHIVGRSKDLIISGGFNVYPAEVETEINALEGVVESAVIGCPHPDFGEGVAAVVVGKSDVSLDEREIIERLAGRLAKFKLPKRVIFVEELPRNAMGKVQKNLLREEYKSIYEN